MAPVKLPLVDLPVLSHPGPPVQDWDQVLAQLTASSSSPDDSTVPGSSSPSVPEDFKIYQDLLCHMAVSLDIQAEFLQDNIHKLLDILQPFASGRVALIINDASLKPTNVLWSVPDSVLPTGKHLEKHYFVSVQRFEGF